MEDISLEELAEGMFTFILNLLVFLNIYISELPENSPRYVIISYPLKHPDGRLAVPLALINWIPTTSSLEMKTLHAS